jgi:hypothetical protein
MWVYINSEPGLWTVGFYSPDGKWNPESDWGMPDKAADRVHYLNGNNDTRIEHLESVLQLAQESRINELEMWRGNRPGG